MTTKMANERRATTTVTVISQPENSPDDIKVGIQLAVSDNIPPAMEVINRQTPLVNIIKSLCDKFKLKDPRHYQLQFDETHVQPPPIYITEENRDKIKNGGILKLDFSPQEMSSSMAEGFSSGNIAKEKIRTLAKLAVDVTFVEHFVTQNGLTHLAKFIVAVANSRDFSKKSGYALSAFVDIMDHDIVSWETVSEEVLESVLWYMDVKTQPDILAIKSALEILEWAVLKSSVGKNFVTGARVDMDHFISTLKTRDVEIQVACISLLNAILNFSPKERKNQIRKKLFSQPTRQLIWENIFTGPIGKEMSFQLYSLQTRLFNLLAERLNGAINVRDPAALKEIAQLRRIAFEDDSETVQQTATLSETRDFTKLGFKTPAEPLQVSLTVLTHHLLC